MNSVYPLLFQPVYRNYVWGGDRIVRRFNRTEPPGVYAESWEVTDRPEGMSVVTNGPLKGKRLSDVVHKMGEALLGVGRTADRFPLLIKWIDAKETLSLQVHPDDRSAARYGGEAKTEMWYVLDAEPSAFVYAGLKPGVTLEEFREAVRSEAVIDLLNKVPVQASDTVFMPGGRVHAIGAGCLLLEVQQNSDTTYRIYDWGRTGADGQSRELHVEKAMEVIRWHDASSVKVAQRCLGHMEQNELWEMFSCPWFRMERMVVREVWPSAHDVRSFQVLCVLDEPVVIETEQGSYPVEPGGTCLIPAALTSYQLSPQAPRTSATVLRVTWP